MASMFVVFSKDELSGLRGLFKNAKGGMQDCDALSSETACYIIADARIDYQEELARKLEIAWEAARDFSDQRFILSAYIKWGDACVDHLYGDFAFAIWDEGRKQLFCSRDHFGVRPLFYLDQPGFFVFASELSAFEDLPDFRYQIREQYLCDAICSVDQHKDEAPFEHIRRLEPAQSLSYSEKKGVVLKRYWDLELHPNDNWLSEEEAAMELKKRFLDAISQRSRNQDHIGIELSGGLDSSGILAGLASNENKPSRISAFTHSRSDQCNAGQHIFSNDLEYSRIMVEEFPVAEHCIVTENNQNGSFSALLHMLQSGPGPVDQVYAMLSDLLFAEAGQAGAGVMLSGFGGDEGVTYNGDGYLEELIRRRKYKQVKEHLRKRVERSGGRLKRQLTKLIIQTYVPSLLQLFQRDWRKQQFDTFAINGEIGKRLGMKKRYYQRSFLPGVPNLRTRQYNRLMLPALTQRLENTALLAGKEGVGYSYPFLDVKLLEFFYSLPSEFKYKEGTGRYLYRSAMRDLLPEKIRLRRDKAGATIPNALCRLLKDADKFREVINEGRENNRFHYVEYNQLLWMLDHFKQVQKDKKLQVSQRAFFAPMSVLILQKWQREGKIDIGIRC